MSPADPMPVSSRAAAPLLEARALAIAGRLSPLDICWHGGQLVALLGPNGSGKSTLLGALAGILPADGTVLLGGEVLTDLSWPELAKRRAMLPQRQPQLFHIPVFQVLSLGLNEAVAPARQNEAINALCEVLELEALLARDFSRLSGGEQQRVLIARTLLQVWPVLNPTGKVLLLDEPLAGLAVAERERIAKLIKMLSREIPVLLVEHDIDRVFQIADHVTVMNDGHVLVDGTVEEARSNEKVREIYIGSGAAAVAAKTHVSAAGAQQLLAVEAIDTFYGKCHILNSVSLDVNEREIVALLGRNGAGKSTLLKTLIGIVPPAAGSIRLAGEDMAGKPSAAIARNGIGYVPQGRGLFAGMTVAQNLELGRLKRLTGKGAHWDEEKVIAFFPKLGNRWRTPADFLSGGEQQMVAVARALVGDVRLLLLDEPFEGLSPAVTEELFEAFDRLRTEIAMVIVDHHLDLALALSDRTVVLERGAVTWRGPSAGLRDDLALRRKVLWL